MTEVQAHHQDFFLAHDRVAQFLVQGYLLKWTSVGEQAVTDPDRLTVLGHTKTLEQDKVLDAVHTAAVVEAVGRYLD